MEEIAEDKIVAFLGCGVYEGDFVPTEAVGYLADKARLHEKRNPRIRLDNGKVVYGCECWWGYEERIKKFKEKNKLEESHDIDKKVEELDHKSDEMQKIILKLREKHHEILREKDKAENKINTIDEEMKKLAGIAKEHKDIAENLEKFREDFKKSTLELNKALDEDSNLAAQIARARDNLQKVNEELSKLQIRESGFKEIKEGDLAVRKILEQKNKIGGIFGTVAGLGQVNSKYALALEVAAGPRIKSIVVEDDKVAAEAIKYLKKNRFGVASFLPLNKIKGKPSDQNITKYAKADGCHGLAIDLVDYDAKFKKIFQYVFSDTLVVDSIDVARRIGIGNARMVSLDGDIAELSGVMQGGYRGGKAKGIGFTEKELADDIRKLEEESAKLTETLSVFEKRRAENEEKISSLRVKKGELEGQIVKIETSLHLGHGDSLTPTKKKGDLLKEAEAHDAQIRQIESEISETNRELANLKIEKMKLREQITHLRNPTLIAELNTFSQKIRELTDRVIQIDTEIKNIDAQIKEIYGPEKEKTESIIKHHLKEEEDFRKELEETGKKMKSLQEVLAEKEEKAKKFFAQFKELFAKRSKINEEINAIDISVNGKIEEKNKVEIKLNTFTLKHAEIKAGFSGLMREFSQYEGVELAMEKNEQQLKYEISKFEKAKDEIGNVNMRALEIYEEVEKEYNSLLDKKDNLRKEKEDVVKLMEEIEGKKKELFMKTFDVVNNNFKKIFAELSTKGEANLVLETPDNPFEGGLRVVVRITGNKFLDIRSLSGGEKTMTALAFIFAIQDNEPASFYILDEVDAALDKHNAEKLAALIRKYSQKAQYIIISHNDGVISDADTLYGVSMNEHGMSQIVSLKV